MEEIKDRIKQIMDQEELTSAAFADRIGVSQATLSHLFNGRNKYPSTEMLLKLHDSFPDLSMDWLLYGGDKQQASSVDSSNMEVNADLFGDIFKNPVNGTEEREERKEIALGEPLKKGKTIVKQEIVYKERPSRKITEIRIFFDDNTYETFIPQKNQ